MRSLVFEGETRLSYEQIRDKDKRLYQALCKVLQEMLRSDPASGLGKPEPLKHISQKDRVIYKFDDDYAYIFAIGGHYQQD